MAVQVSPRAVFRMRLAYFIIVSIGLLLGARLFYWQVVQWDTLSKRAEQQQIFDAPVYARRGTILTRDNLPLAEDVFLYTIIVSPQGVLNKEEWASRLAPLLKQSRETLLGKLNSKSQSVILAQDVPVDMGASVQELKNRWLSKNSDVLALQITARPVRRYPAGAFAEHVVGFVNAERKAANGVEQFKDAELRGTDGSIRGAGNALHDDVIPYDLPLNTPPTDGADIVLTIDSGIQRIAESELFGAIKETHATSGSVIVMDPQTGAILAIANYPTAELNAYYDQGNAGRYVNAAVSAQYEPGSVFKIVTVAAALDADTVTLSSVFYDAGSILFGGANIKNHDDLAPGRVTLTDVIRQSLNVEAAKMSVGLGAERFYQYVRKFGFGVPTRVELAAEATGEVKSPGDGRWHEVDLATNAFGQGISVTPLQMISAVAAVANQGKLMRPYIVQEMHYPSGQVTRTSPEVVRQVIRPETAQTLTRLLGDAIIGESTNKAIVPGYRIAGKTGTAQIPIVGAFDPRWTIASFVGYLPADDPRLIILVKLDKPQTSPWGSQVAAPVFASIGKQLVSMIGLPPDTVRLAAR